MKNNVTMTEHIERKLVEAETTNECISSCFSELVNPSSTMEMEEEPNDQVNKFARALNINVGDQKNTVTI